MIYIDLGAYNGDSVEQFINWGQVLGDISEAEIYAFDPIKGFEAEWEDIKTRQQKHVGSIEFIQSAAWIDEDGLEFSYWKEQPLGSTVMAQKRNWYAGQIIGVKSFDFSEFLWQFDGKEIIIKMDIEGAEYPVLEKMIADGTDKLVKLMMIEFHGDKMGQEFRNKEDSIKKNLSCRWLEWR